MSEQQLANQIEQLQTQISRMQQMAALGELVGTTTHEFNNYLMTIINYAKIGLRNNDEETRNKALQKIHDAGLKAAEITKVILGTARNRPEKMEATDLRPIVEQSVLLLERELRKYQINLETQLEDVPSVLGHGNQLQQVLINLIVNARQATEPGGQITIRLCENRESGTIDFSVRDSGHGMKPETMKRIFDPQYSTKAGPDATGKGGTGFGLFNCRQIIEEHRGKIRVESRPGEGTCFTIKLQPVASSVEHATNNRKSATQGSAPVAS